MILISSCSKDAVVVSQGSPVKINIKKTRAASVVYEIPRYVDGSDGKPFLTDCFSSGGNCLKTVVVKAPKLSGILESGGQSIANYFSGTEWQEHFDADVIGDSDFVSFIQSGHVNVVSGVGGDGQTYYFLNNEAGVTPDVTNADYIIPFE